MYKNKSSNGSNNICGGKIKELRLQLPKKTSQRKLADMLQIQGLDVDKNIELKAIAQILNVSCDTLLGIDMPIK